MYLQIGADQLQRAIVRLHSVAGGKGLRVLRRDFNFGCA
jgi:hypothetical protein